MTSADRISAAVLASPLYSLMRVLLDVVATSHGDQAKLQGEVLALRGQVQVLERQVKRVRWSPGDRMVLAALTAPSGSPTAKKTANTANDGGCRRTITESGRSRLNWDGRWGTVADAGSAVFKTVCGLG